MSVGWFRLFLCWQEKVLCRTPWFTIRMLRGDGSFLVCHHLKADNPQKFENCLNINIWDVLWRNIAPGDESAFFWRHHGEETRHLKHFENRSISENGGFWMEKSLTLEMAVERRVPPLSLWKPIAFVAMMGSSRQFQLATAANWLINYNKHKGRNIRIGFM